MKSYSEDIRPKNTLPKINSCNMRFTYTLSFRSFMIVYCTREENCLLGNI